MKPVIYLPLIERTKNLIDSINGYDPGSLPDMALKVCLEEIDVTEKALWKAVAATEGISVDAAGAGAEKRALNQVSIAAILPNGDEVVVTVTVPAWAKEVVLVDLPEFDAHTNLAVLLPATLRDLLQQGGEEIDARAQLVATCWLDESGERMFTAEEILNLRCKSARHASAIERLLDKAAEINGLSMIDKSDLRRIKELLVELTTLRTKLTEPQLAN
jgi:hypothetical protein